MSQLSPSRGHFFLHQEELNLNKFNQTLRNLSERLNEQFRVIGVKSHKRENSFALLLVLKPRGCVETQRWDYCAVEEGVRWRKGIRTMSGLEPCYESWNVLHLPKYHCLCRKPTSKSIVSLNFSKLFFVT